MPISWNSPQLRGSSCEPLGVAWTNQDDETDWVYYGQRFYSPALGRWENRDPIGEAGGLNLYGYVVNNPVNETDPYGLSSNDVLKIQRSFYETRDWMSQVGLRLPGYPNANNFLTVVGGTPDFWVKPSHLLGGPYNAYLGCGDQEEMMRKVLKAQEYEDKWTFTSDARLWKPTHPLDGPHVWGVATSSNPLDPVIKYDPWYGFITPSPKISPTPINLNANRPPDFLYGSGSAGFFSIWIPTPK